MSQGIEEGEGVKNLGEPGGVSGPRSVNGHMEQRASSTKRVRIKPIGKDGHGNAWTYGLFPYTGGPAIKRSDYPDRLRTFANQQGWELLS